MQVKDLEANSKVTDLLVAVTNLEEPRETPTGKQLQEAIITDSTGQVKLTLWGEDVMAYSIGDKVKIVSGWCKEYQNELQVTTGKFGKIEKVE